MSRLDLVRHHDGHEGGGVQLLHLRLAHDAQERDRVQFLLRSPIGRLVSLIKHMVGVALEKSPSRVRKSSDSPDRLSNATESRYRGSNATKVALERL